jgi:leucyl/phenylalanyl-tRNA--protein transferase
MFTRSRDASKIAFVHLVRRLAAEDYRLIDCQMHTAHLASLGAREIPRTEFARRLKDLVDYPRPPGRWVQGGERERSPKIEACRN